MYIYYYPNSIIDINRENVIKLSYNINMFE